MGRVKKETYFGLLVLAFFAAAYGVPKIAESFPLLALVFGLICTAAMGLCIKKGGLYNDGK